MNLEEAKALCNEGDNLKIVCQELKSLRNAIRCARGWQIRVKKCKVEQGGLCANEAEKLTAEHDKLLIAMKEDVGRIKQAMKSYCLCRRPYEGFMIGCDGCDEWYHGSCIGVSETQADRFEKYLCVRCCVKKVFKNSSIAVAGIIKKWTSDKERKKARQAQYQKHQRKVRKERKDIEKFEKQIRELYNPHASQTSKLNNTDLNPLDSQKDANNKDVKVSESVNGKGEITSEISTEKKAVVCAEPLPKSIGSVTELKENGGNLGSVAKVHNKEDAAAPGACITISPEIEDRISKLRQEISKCRDRMGVLQMRAKERSDLEREEDRLSQQLRVWCIRVRSKVLVPTTTQHAELSRPLSYGRLSPPMLDVFNDAEVFRIDHLPDIHLIANAFKSICWSSFVMSKLSKKPSLEDIQHVVEISSSINLPDEKAIKMLKAMIQRTTQWQMKVRKCLTPKPGETKPFSIEALKSVDALSSSVPFDVPEAICLSNAIEDKGARYCCCGGANDSTFMLSCDKCERWFHGRCVNVDASNVPENWVCQHCKEDEKAVTLEVDIENWFDFTSTEDDSSISSSIQSDAPNAPTIEKLWPPFKLLESEEAKEALGEVCVAIPDEHGYVAGLDDVLREDLPSLGRKEEYDGTAKCSADKITTKAGMGNCTEVKMEGNSIEEVHRDKKPKLSISVIESTSSDLQENVNISNMSAISKQEGKAHPEAVKSEATNTEGTKTAAKASSMAHSLNPIATQVAESLQSSGKLLKSDQFEKTQEKSKSSLLVQKQQETNEPHISDTIGNQLSENGLKVVVSDDGSHSTELVQEKKSDEKSFVVEGTTLEKIPVVVSPELGGDNEKQVLESENEILRVPCKG